MERYDIAFQPFVDWPYLWILAAIAGAIAALIVWRMGGRGLPRVVAVALGLLALANPALVREEREPLKDIVAVVVDRSDSQSLGDRAAQTEAALAALRTSLGADPGVELRVIESASNGEATALFEPLRKALADVPQDRLGGVIMLTDGQVHDIPASVDALGFKAPVHALVTGHAKERDRRIELVEAPRFGIVGKDAGFVTRLRDEGGDGAPADLIVRRDGVEILRRRAAPGVAIRLPLRVEHGGPNVFEFEVETAPDELTGRNNRVVATLDGVRDKLKVLLVSGEPHSGERTWRNLLRSDANVDLVHFTILRQPDKVDATPINEMALIAFPTAELFGAKIKEFDLVIFDRYSNQRILQQSYLENIVRYVRDGGALLLAAGPDFAGEAGIFHSPIGALAPAAPRGGLIERPFKPKISEIGARHPVTRDLPGAGPDPQWSVWFRQVMAEKTRGADVMVGADNQPLLVLSREGKGRVAELLSDQIWLWARGYEGGGPYSDLLRRMAHWLMKEPELEEEALRARARKTGAETQLVIERQTLSQVDEPVTITAPSGAETEMRLQEAGPGLARGAAPARETGLYRLRSGALSVLANVGADNPREFQDVLSTTERLRPLAETTGGSARRIEGAGAAVALPRVVGLREQRSYAGLDWIAWRKNDSAAVRAIGAAPIGLGLIAALAMLGVLIAAWFTEGRR